MALRSTSSTSKAMDRRGKTIATYVVFDVAAELATRREGDVLEVITDAFEPFRHHIAAWCTTTGHRLVASESTPEGLRFQIAKGSSATADASVAVVISSDGLQELLSPLSFALAAALEGMGGAHLHPGSRCAGPNARLPAEASRLGTAVHSFRRLGLTRAGHLPARESCASS